LKCRYGLQHPINSNCKKGSANRECNEAKTAYKCYQDCEQFAEQRNLRGKPEHDREKYVEFMEKCKNPKCDAYFPKNCGICIDSCAAQGEREYQTALGTNHFRKNYEGWGCLELCKCKNVINLAKTDVVPVDVPQPLAIQEAVGVVSGNTATMVTNKRKKQRKKKQRRPSRRRVRKALRD